MDGLEKGISQFKLVSKELHDAKGDLSSTQEKLQELIDKNKSLNTEFTKLKETTSDLEIQLTNAEETKKKLKIALEESINKMDDLKHKISEKEQQLSQKEKETEEVLKEISSIKIKFSDTNQEIEHFKEKYKNKISDFKLKIFELSSLKDNLENNIKESVSHQEIINKIEELLHQKGFLSDKEYESISKKNLDQIYNKIY